MLTITLSLLFVSWLGQRSKYATVCIYTRKTHSSAIFWGLVYKACGQGVYKEFLYCKYTAYELSKNRGLSPHTK